MKRPELTKIGLTGGESRVYLSLLELGSSTTGPIVDRAKVSRSKIYHILERLMEKGLVTSIVKEKTKYFQAADPNRLLNYIDVQKEELDTNRKYVEKILPQLEEQRQAAVREEEAQIYTGLEGIKTARELVLRTLKPGDTFYCLGANIINQEPLAGYWEDFHRRRAKMGIKAKYIIQEESRLTMGKKRPYREGGSVLMEVRYFDFTGPVHIDIFGDYVVTCIMKGTNMSFLIRNKFVAEYYRDYFEKVWKVAKH